MESFFRYISYVDYYKKGEKIKNVGFLRWKLYNGEHRIEIQLKDLSDVQGDFEIREKNTGKSIGKIKIDKGIGNFIKRIPFMMASGEMYIDTFDDRLYLCDVEGFLIYIKGEEYLSIDIGLEEEKKGKQILKEAGGASENILIDGVKEKYTEARYVKVEEKNTEVKPVKAEEKYMEVKPVKKEERYTEAKPVKIEERYIEAKPVKEEERYIEARPVKEGERYTEVRPVKVEERYIEARPVKEEDKDTKIKHVKIENSYVDVASNKKLRIIEPVHENKWKQLCSKYQHVHPFPGNKIFLSIKLEDFIILQQKHQKLVHNSFLLHGFYNYGHMILGKLTEEEEAPVYIGVPGVYYEREKQAAQMFGFVGFESAEHPVQPGSYGYYMIEVEL